MRPVASIALQTFCIQLSETLDSTSCPSQALKNYRFCSANKRPAELSAGLNAIKNKQLHEGTRLFRMKLPGSAVGLRAGSETLPSLNLVVVRCVGSEILDPNGVIVVAI